MGYEVSQIFSLLGDFAYLLDMTISSMDAIQPPAENWNAAEMM